MDIRRLIVVLVALSLGLAALTSRLTAQPSRPANDNDDDRPRAGRAVYVGHEMLLDYDPTPTLVTKETHLDRPKFPAIDIHCHWSLDQDPSAMLAAMDELGIRAAVNLSGGFGEKLDAMLAKFHAAAPDRLLIFCNLDFAGIDDPDWSRRAVAELERGRRAGASGLKIFKSLGLTLKDKSGAVIRVDDPRLDPVWAKCGELGMPVLIHSADPLPFFQPIDRHNERWMQLKRHPSWSFHGDNFPDRDDVLEQRNNVVKRHPGTIFIGAHMGESGEDLARLSRWLDEMPNFYVDISGREGEIGRQPYAARRFFIEHADRILFGTDRYPGRPDQPRERLYYRLLETDDEYFKYYDHPFPPTGEWNIYGLFLPDDVLRKVYHENARRALGLNHP